MRELKRLLIGLASAAAWPSYLALVAAAAMLAPWPRELAWPASLILLCLAAALLVANAGRMAFGKGGWAEANFAAPKDVTRQLRRVTMTVAIAGLALLMPELLLNGGMIGPGGRPISAPSLGRLLVLGFELTGWALAYRLLRRTSPLLDWLAQDPARLGRLGRNRRFVAPVILAVLALVVTLDALGYRFTARRLSLGGLSSLAWLGACWVAHRLLLGLIDHHGWRWKKGGTEPAATPPATAAVSEGVDQPEDAARKLRKLALALVTVVGTLGAAWIWNVDLVLFRYIGGLTLWKLSDRTIYVGDAVEMLAILFVTAGAWRNLNAFFTVAIFPRMADDPGIRFAVVTLCRYLVLAVGLLAGLSAVHLGLEKIGVVLAALGVGLGFGLQEIVSNFVSGIILLLERPIRVGDLVTVASMTGRVDRINIRATTIINGDNQSMIVPNREFITGNLVNWTHTDKIVRVAIKLNVALGTDPDRVTDLLLAIAHDDPDVLNNPVPVALLDSIGDACLIFFLYIFVPEPSVMGRARHRVNASIQKRFEAAGIVIPLPIRELRVHSVPIEGGAEPQVVPRPHGHRHDPKQTPTPHFAARGPLPEPAEECHRGVDE